MQEPKPLNLDKVGGNQFRFKGFREQIEDVDVNVHVRPELVTLSSELGVHDSLFAQRIDHWKLLDHSGHFKAFLKDLQKNETCPSLPLLLINKDRVVAVLLHHLQVPESLAISALLDLLVVLTKDIRSEIYLMFDDILETLVQILDPKFPKLLERIFSALAYLFKFLIRNILRDFVPLFEKHFKKFLGHQKPYVRQFAAESVSFLLRKIPADEFPLVFSEISCSRLLGRSNHARGEGLKDGFANLMFEVVKGVRNGFRTCVAHVIPVYIQRLRDSVDEDCLYFSSLSSAFHLMNEHARPETAGLVWDVILEKAIASFSQDCEDEIRAKFTHRVLAVCSDWCSNRRGTRIGSSSLLTKLIQSVLCFPWVSRKHCFQQFWGSLASLLKALLIFKPDAVMSVFVHQTELASSFIHLSTLDDLLSFSIEMSSPKTFTTFDEIFFPHVLDVFKFLDVSEMGKVLEVLDRVCLLDGSTFSCPYRLKAFLHASSGSALLDRIMLYLQSHQADGEPHLFRVSMFIISQGPENRYLEIISMLTSLWNEISCGLHARFALYVAMCSGLLDTQNQKSMKASCAFLPESIANVSRFLVESHSLIDNDTLSSSFLLLTRANENGISLLSWKNEQLAHFAMRSLSSSYSEVRKSSSSLLARFPKLTFNSGTSSVFVGTCELLSNINEILLQDPSIDVERHVVVFINNLKLMISSGALPPKYFEAVVYFAVGMLHVKFQPYWSPIQSLLISAGSSCSAPMMDFVYKVLEDSYQTLRKDERVSSGSTDSQTFFLQLIQVFRDSKDFFSKYVSQLSDMFLHFFNSVYVDQTRWDQNQGSDQDDQAHNSLSMKHLRSQAVILIEVSARLAQVKSRVSLERRDNILQKLKQLLMKKDSVVQENAIVSISAWESDESSYLKTNLSHLRELCKCDRNRDVLLLFPRADLSEQEKGALDEIVLRILYPKIVFCHGDNKDRVRNQVFQYLGANFAPEELGFLVDSLVSPMSGSLDRGFIRRATCFAIVVECMLKTSKLILAAHLKTFVLSIIHVARVTARDTTKNSRTKTERHLHQKALSILAQMITSFPSFKWLEVAELSELIEFLESDIKNLSLENTQHVSGLWDCIRAWFTSDELITGILGRLPFVLESAAKCLSAVSVSRQIVSFVYDLFFELFSRSCPEEITVYTTEIQEIARSHVSNLLGQMLCRKRQSNDSTIFGSHEINFLPIVLKSVDVQSLDADVVASFIDLMLPMISLRNLEMEKKTKLLVLLSELASSPVIDLISAQVQEWLRSLSSLFLKLKTPAHIEYLALSFASLGRESVPECLLEVLSDLNSFDKSTVQFEIDFERKLKAHQSIQNSSFDADSLQSFSGVSALVATLLRDCSHSDFSLRRSSRDSMLRILSLVDEQMLSGFLSLQITPHFLNLIKFDLPLLVKKDVVGILSALASGFHDRNEKLREIHQVNEMYRTSKSVDSSEDDDFLSQLLHIQIHVRRKAVLWIARFNSDLPCWICQALIIPVVSQILFTPNKRLQDGKFLPFQVANERSIKEFDRLHGLIEDALRVLPLLSRKLAPAKWRNLLQLFLSRLDVSVDDDYYVEIWHRVTVRAVCVLVEQIPQDCKVDTAFYDQIQRDLVPRLFRYMKLGQEDVEFSSDKFVRMHLTVAVALATLLKQLPQEVCELHLPRLINGLIHLLKNKQQAVRDAVHKSLVAVLVAVGPGHLPQVISDMKSILKQDFQVFTLASVISSIFEALSAQGSSIELDQSVVMIVDILLDNLFGEPAIERKREGVRACKEMGTDKMIHAFSSIARHVHEEGAIESIMRRFDDTLRKCKTTDSFSLMETVLKSVSTGLKENQRLSTQFLISFALGFLSRCDSEPVEDFNVQDQAISSKTSRLVTFKVLDLPRNEALRKPSLGSDAASNWSGSTDSVASKVNELYAWFSFLVILGTLKSRTSDVNGDVLEQIVSASLECCRKFKSSISIMISIVRILTVLIKHGQESLPLLKKRFNSLGNIFVSSAIATSSHELSSGCFEGLASLLIHAKSFQLKQSHLVTLVEMIEKDILDTTSKHSSSFPLLKAILGRRLTAPALTSLVEKMFPICIQSPDDSLRKRCQQVCLNYLVNYPMKEKARQSHVQFFLNNLSYEHPWGRESALHVISGLISDFPQTMLDEHAELLFLPLVLALAKEVDSSVAERIAAVISKLVSSISSSILDKFLDSAVAWTDESKPLTLRRTAFKLLALFFPNLVSLKAGIVSQCLGESLRKLRDEFVDYLESRLETALVPSLIVELLRALQVVPVNNLNDSLDFGTFPNSRVSEECEKLWSIHIHHLDDTVVARIILERISSTDEKPSLSIQNCIVSLFDTPSRAMLVRSLAALTRRKAQKETLAQLVLEGARKLTMEDIEDVIQSLASLVFKLSTCESESVQNAGVAISKTVEDLVGIDAFREAYEKSRKVLEKLKRERKEKSLTLALTNPDVAARKKAKQNKKKAISRKRKNHEMQAIRQGHSVEMAAVLSRKKVKLTK